MSSHGQVSGDAGEILCTKAKAQNEYHLQACLARTWDTPAFKTALTMAQSDQKRKDATNLSDQPSSSTKSSAVV